MHEGVPVADDGLVVTIHPASAQVLDCCRRRRILRPARGELPPIERPPA